MVNVEVSCDSSSDLRLRATSELRTSVLAFLFGCSSHLVLYWIGILSLDGYGWFFMHSLAFSPIFVTLSFFIFGDKRNVAVQASFLGCVVALGFLLKLSPYMVLWHAFGLYMIVMGVFHWSEYVCTALTSPCTLSLDSFLLNHSVQYWIAAGASWIEFALGTFFIPKLKLLPVISALGLVLCIIGESLRKCAMLTAGGNFTHLISFEKKEGHQLITTGIYSIFRHPGYVGWLLWSVGTQVLLCNPICLLGYAWASWSFFRVRIEEEEVTLINFFNEDYVHYQRQVPTGIPFVVGFRPDLSP